MLRNTNVALVAVAMSVSTYDVEGLKLSLKAHTGMSPWIPRGRTYPEEELLLAAGPSSNSKNA